MAEQIGALCDASVKRRFSETARRPHGPSSLSAAQMGATRVIRHLMGPNPVTATEGGEGPIRNSVPGPSQEGRGEGRGRGGQGRGGAGEEGRGG